MRPYSANILINVNNVTELYRSNNMSN